MNKREKEGILVFPLHLGTNGFSTHTLAPSPFFKIHPSLLLKRNIIFSMFFQTTSLDL
jgi:hypothetical protein